MSSCLSSRQARGPGCQEEPQGRQGFRRCLWQGIPKSGSKARHQILLGRAEERESKPLVELMLSVVFPQTQEFFLIYSMVSFAIRFCWEKLTLVGQGLTVPETLCWCWELSSLTLGKSTSGSFYISCRGRKLLFITQWDPGCSICWFSSSRAWSRGRSRGWKLDPAGVQSAKLW